MLVDIGKTRQGMFVDVREVTVAGEGCLVGEDHVGGGVAERTGNYFLLRDLLAEAGKVHHVEARVKHHVLLVEPVQLEKSIIESCLGQIAQGCLL